MPCSVSAVTRWLLPLMCEESSVLNVLHRARCLAYRVCCARSPSWERLPSCTRRVVRKRLRSDPDAPTRHSSVGEEWLLARGWRLAPVPHAWCWWKPPLRGARYRLKDALALERSCSPKHTSN